MGWRYRGTGGKEKGVELAFRKDCFISLEIGQGAALLRNSGGLLADCGSFILLLIARNC